MKTMFLDLPLWSQGVMMLDMLDIDQDQLQCIEDHVFRRCNTAFKWHAQTPQDLHPDIWKSVAARALRLSDDFTLNRTDEFPLYLDDPVTLAAYALYFHTANVMRAHQVFAQTPFPINKKRTLRMLDVGCGTAAGTQAWSNWVVAHDPTKNLEAHLFDQSQSALEFAKRLIEKDPTVHRTVDVKTMTELPDHGKYDVIFVGNVLNELPVKQQELMLTQLSELLSKQGLLMIMEPALLEPTRSLMAMKASLQTNQLWTLAPCSHNDVCPMLLDTQQWCHFSVQWQPPALRSRLEKNLKHQSGNLSYAYLLASKYKPVHAGRRVVSKVLKTKVKKISALLTCMPENIETLYFNKKHPGLGKMPKGSLIRLSQVLAPPATVERVTPSHQVAKWVDDNAVVETIKVQSPLHVVALILYTPDQKIWLGQRRKGDSSEGYWEFPGGKIEPGESPKKALIREIQEELSMDATSSQVFHAFSYRYPTREVHLTFYAQQVETPLDIATTAHDQGQWVGIHDVHTLKLLEANHALLPMLKERLWS